MSEVKRDERGAHADLPLNANMACASAFGRPVASSWLPDRFLAGLASLLIGGFLIFGVGLAHSDRLHNAAHDTRHALVFPCH